MHSLAVTLQILLLISGLFLILIILLQRGRGGGLAGAFGGTGGQSAFGTKAGDIFTWITIVTATIWVLLAGIGGCAMRKASTSVESRLGGAADEDEPGSMSSTKDSDEKDADQQTDQESTITPPALPEKTGEADETTPDAPEANESSDTPPAETSSNSPPADDNAANETTDAPKTEN